MTKITPLSDITNINTAAPTINANSLRIENALENTLSRDGSSPNQMEADLDLNNYDILNVKDLFVSGTLTVGGGIIGDGNSGGGGGGGDATAEVELAHAWAQAPEDVEVDSVNYPNEYSSYHWAKKAEASAIEAASFATEQFSIASVADLLASVLSFDEGDYILTRKEGFSYVVANPSASNHHIITAGGIKMYIVGRAISPEHFGATVGVSTNSASYIQAASDVVRASWNQANWSFDRDLDFLGKTFRADSSINFSGARNPRIKVRNGQLVSRASGKIAFDCALNNGMIFENFLVFGERDYAPAWGIYTGRALSNGNYPGCDGVTFEGTSGAWGYFNRGAYLAFAAEVQAWDDRTVFENKSRSLSAVSVACIDDMAICVNQFGSETTSDFQTLPTAATGNHSNVCHTWGQVNMRRPADYNLIVTAISKSNPMVITVSGGIAANNIQPGDYVFISGGTMTQVAYYSHLVTAVNDTANTITIGGTNSSSYTAYTSGASLQNRTGVALLCGGMRTVSSSGSYFLTYGAPNIIFDLNDGGAPYDWKLHYQSERHSDDQIQFRLASGTVVMPQMEFYSTMTSQVAHRSVMRINGAGNVRFEGGGLYISNMAGAPSASVFSPQTSFSARGYHLEVPLAAALPDPDAMIDFQGIMVAQNRSPVVSLHGCSLNFRASSTALTAPGLRWSGSGLFSYRPTLGAERAVSINDQDSSANLANISSRINTEDKYAGKMVWNVTTNRPVWATGGGANFSWRDATGAVVHTPV